MIIFLIICILFVIVAVGTFQKELDKNKKDLKKFNNKNFKATISSNYKDKSIIDVTGQSTRIDSNLHKTKYSREVPKWANKNIYSFSEITNATSEQINFYNSYKKSFFNGEVISLEGNYNYAFILMFELISEYKKDKNFLKLETRLNKLGNCWPDTKYYITSFLNQNRNNDNNPSTFYPNNDYYDEYWKLGSKYKKKLNLNENEVKLLNHVYSPSNNFFSIEYCCLEIMKLYIAVLSRLKDKYIKEDTTIDDQFLIVADIIVRKHFKYRKGSQNYKYSIQTATNEFYSNIFKHCENVVREYYGHKRKINTDTYYYTTTDAKTEFETKIISKVKDLLPILITEISPPDEVTEIVLYAQNSSRWKIKFEELTVNYNEKPKEFVDAILVLGKLNKRNPSVKNIFFEASKFIAKHDKESSLILYINYLYEDLKSVTFDNKKHSKTIQKSLFTTNEQLQDFEKIVSELINDKDLNKALKQIPEIYKIKRKKIKFDTASIKEVIEQHSGTVELLNEYLQDDFEDENNTIKSKGESKEEIKIEKTQISDEAITSSFTSDLPLKPIHIATLELFSKNNFSIPQIELEVFSRSKGLFKNQLIESINEICYDYLDDILIEEEDDYYTINTNYFQRISVK